ncbi:tryptophan-rich sensory protein [Sphingomonas sp. BE138]|uniref:TspO/MBR family protein n=1 Tax=Sphingomonas sp. BE138 TaxID=2817845 RepID=UPI0028674038|nr:TspO/MBR family protein [Sphingomonas sp. BE138]MDR6789948.1 tryptophan-rich sensory protein [Sphingomonas sp. BE138]
MGELASRSQLRMDFVRAAAVLIPAVLLLGFLSGRTVPSGEQNGWYAALAKPDFTPPGWAFPVVWSVLYVMLGLAIAMIVSARGARLRGLGAALFVAQLAGNLAWTPLFFGAHRVDAAFLLIVAILGLSVLATIVFAQIRRAAAWLMVPYMAWLCLAAALNWEIGRLNPDAERVVQAPVASQMIR